MKTLPLLSSSFPYFSWETQFGNATSTHLRNGYAALTGEGRTAEFHRYIWNDMVDLLSRALSEAGLSWNNAYGTAKDTKVLEKYGMFTAQKFNAVTINIDQIIKNAWQWEVNQMFIGYVARPRFYGVTEKKDKGDYLYGQYILELARVLNQFIAILKNEADFAEFIIREKSSTPTKVTASSQKSAPMGYGRSSYTKPIVEAVKNQSRPMYVSLYSSSKPQVVLTAQGLRYLAYKGHSHTPSDATVTANKVARMTYKGYSYTPKEVSMNNPRVRRLLSSNESKGNLIATLRNPMVTHAEYETLIYALNESDLKNPIAQTMGYESISSFNDISEATVPKVTHANSEEIATSNNNVDVIVGRPKFPYSYETSNSSTDTEPNVLSSKPFSIKEKAKTIESTILAKGNILKLGATIKSKTSVIAAIDGAVENTWVKQDGSNLFIYQIYDGYKETSTLYIDTEYWLAPIQNGTDLFIRQIYDNDEVKGE